MYSYINFEDALQKRSVNVPQHGLAPPHLSQAFPRASHRSFNSFWLVGKITRLVLFEAYYCTFYIFWLRWLLLPSVVLGF